MSLSLVPPPIAVAAGDSIYVPEPVALPCGRRVRTGVYTVRRVLGRRIEIETTLDCSALPKMYHPPTREDYERARQRGEPPPRVPIAAEVKRPQLSPGQWTRLDPETTDGRHPATIHDR